MIRFSAGLHRNLGARKALRSSFTELVGDRDFVLLACGGCGSPTNDPPPRGSRGSPGRTARTARGPSAMDPDRRPAREPLRPEMLEVAGGGSVELSVLRRIVH